MRYLDNCRIRIDEDLAENAISPSYKSQYYLSNGISNTCHFDNAGMAVYSNERVAIIDVSLLYRMLTSLCHLS